MQIASKQTAALLDVLNEALAADEQRRKAAVWSRADLPGKTGANKKITDSTLATQAIPQPERAGLSLPVLQPSPPTKSLMIPLPATIFNRSFRFSGDRGARRSGCRTDCARGPGDGHAL